jgi:hypothetical protein
MNSGKRVWKWAGTVLVVACAAVGIAHLLLTQLEGPALDTDTPAILSSDSSGGNAVPSAQRESAAAKRAISSAVRNHSAENLRAARLSSGSPQNGLATKSPAQTGNHKPQVTNFPLAASIDNRQSSIINSIRPLGIVEMADGRVQAVIQDGEWTRVVEAGEVLADNSRVLKVSAEGVEILRPTSDANIELARDTDKAPRAPKAEMAQASAAAKAAQSETAARERVGIAVERFPKKPARRSSGEDQLPGLEEGAASYRTAPQRKPSAIADPGESKLTEFAPDAKQVPAEKPTHPALGRQSPLGTVEHSDGRVETIVADGQWVKLVPEGAESAGTPGQPEGKVIGARTGVSRVNDDGKSATQVKVTVGSQSGSGRPIQKLEFPFRNSVQPIGIVEWPGGRTQAVIAQGDSINFVEDSSTLAETRKMLATTPPPEVSGMDPWFDAAEPPGRQREDGAAKLALVEDESSTRGPPEASAAPLPLPDEIARGQPGEGEFADLSRAPPVRDSAESGLLEEELPGIENATAASIEPLHSIENLPDALLGRSMGTASGSVSRIQLRNAENTESALPIAAVDEQKLALTPVQTDDHDQKNDPKVLGVVRLMDGRERLVVSLGESVMLVDEGEVLPEGSLVNRVGPTASTVSAEAEGSSMPAGKATLTDHPKAGGVHQTIGKPSGSPPAGGLQTEPRLRDNRKQSRR